MEGDEMEGSVLAVTTLVLGCRSDGLVPGDSAPNDLQKSINMHKHGNGYHSLVTLL